MYKTSYPLKFSSNLPASYDSDLRAIIFCHFITNLINHYVSKVAGTGKKLILQSYLFNKKRT